MSILKCKICGGDIELNSDKTIGTCENCGTQITLPKISDDQRLSMFNRGNAFRRAGEFDKALALYENIVREDDTDAEAHWCCALCRFGIEYVEDPATFEFVPTCHRASFDSFLDDIDYKAAIENADGITRRQYQKDAMKIADVQKGILATSQNEEPFDIFICYKETDDNTGSRTRDSIDAQEIYYQLSNEGYRVFFSRITLEDKAGTEYEPYIFAALNSAKVMVVIGSKPEYFNAAWVKNEWSRFLAIMRKDRTKLLLPCYKNMDPYDLPEQLSVLQSYDMTKIGFIQDLIHGVKKVVDSSKQNPQTAETKAITSTASESASSNISPLLKRAFMFLEDGNWEDADAYCERVLDLDPECAEAYLGKLMAELKVSKEEDLKNCAEPFDNLDNFYKASRFSEEYSEILRKDNEDIRLRNSENGRIEAYNKAISLMESAYSEDDYIHASEQFKALKGYKDSEEKEKECLEKAETVSKDDIYDSAVRMMTKTGSSDKRAAALSKAIESFRSISGYKDSDEKIEQAEKMLEEAKADNNGSNKQFRNIAFSIIAVVLLLVILIVVSKLSSHRSTDYYETTYEVDYAEKQAEDESPAEEATADLPVTFENYMSIMESDPDLYREIFAQTISASVSHYVALKNDGTVVATGSNDFGECDVSDWTDIISVSAGDMTTAALKADGTVVTAGLSYDAPYWTDIVTISVGFDYVVGLKSDGTVVAAGRNDEGQCEVSDWTDIVDIRAGEYHTIGLRSDGTVVAAGLNDNGQCDVSDWTDITGIATGCYHTVGLKSDGTVVSVGYNEDGQCDVSEYSDCTAVFAGAYQTIVLSNKTFTIIGYNYFGQCNISDLADSLVILSPGFYHSIALLSDGTVVATYYTGDDEDYCDVSDWSNIKMPYIYDH